MPRLDLYTSAQPLDCRFAEGEKTNGRWAMAAVVGILGQEILGVTPAWYLHGEKVRVPFAVHMASLQSLPQLHQ